MISSVEKRLEALPQFIKELVSRAVVEVNPLRIYLFGSRVRGDFFENSDLDIGFKLDEHSKKWALFAAYENERARTLLVLDLVNFSDAHRKLCDEIQTNGVLIYERPHSI